MMDIVDEDGRGGEDGSTLANGMREEQRKRRSKSPLSNSEDSLTVISKEFNHNRDKDGRITLYADKLNMKEVDVGGNMTRDEMYLRKKSELSMQDEIQQLALKKRDILMKGKEPRRWKEEIQKSIEREIERRVRDALQTPPLERMLRNKHRAKLRKMQMEKELQDQQKYLISADCSNYAKNLPSLRLHYPWNDIHSSAKYYEMQGLGWCSDKDKQGDTSNYQMGKYSGSSGLANTVAITSPTLASLLDGTTNECNEHEDDTDQVITHIKRKAYHLYTRQGFKEALKTGKLKLKKIGNGKFMDKNGVILSADGPFWPPECGPLYPKPEHISGMPREKELLSSDVPQESRTVENQKTKWFRPWEGAQVVFDSERISKGTVPHTMPDRCSQSIAFESRFESGNLRQARRVGQFEYELVLKTDLYTNRHTQWFYFRIQKMMLGVTYKFNIINLLKKDSLYNHGMRPLFYSENLANTKGLGWHRVGHHITYSRNYNLSRNPLLHPEIAYYSLVWQMEFPEEDDVCFLCHCYPFTFTDLCQHLDMICYDSERTKYVKREVMCETRAGNSCFLLTVGNFGDKTRDKMKKGVVVTARVHPGETNSSWMMKGFLDFITSDDSVANNLRKVFTFKIVPMLNPDGVIVGNYRCSLSARDLNRNFRHPKKDSFPTIWHTKNMLEEFGEETDVIAYCDLHGHSRKHNVFIYGCDQQGKKLDAATFLCQRLFPWLISKKAPEKFSFGRCKFQVRRCKESTGRVVMWRQMGISNSFTMEATFCGSKNTETGDVPRHFTTLDFQDMGRHFCEALLEYHNAQEDNSLHSEFILELTKVITHQVLISRGLLPQNFAKGLAAEHEDEQDTLLHKSDGHHIRQETASSLQHATFTRDRGDAGVAPGMTKTDTSLATTKIKSRTISSRNLQSCKAVKLKKKKKGDLDSKIHSKLEALQFFDSMDSETIQGCINLIHELHLMSELAESESSDSDSASESEIPGDPGERDRGSRGMKLKRTKRKSKKKAFSAQGDVIDGKKSTKPRRKSTASAGKFPTMKYTPYVNRYLHRSNNGIPMFSEERTQERAIKRLEAMRQIERDHLEKAHKVLEDDEYARLIALTRELQKQEAEIHFKLSSPLADPLYTSPESTMNSAENNIEKRGISSQGSNAPMPRKLQPVAGVKYQHDQPGCNYETGFHISKYGGEDQTTDHVVRTYNKRRSVTSLGSNPIYSSDGLTSVDLELSPKIHCNNDGMMSDFEIPPMFQETREDIHPSRRRVAASGSSILNCHPLQGVKLSSQGGGHSLDLSNNQQSPPKCPQTSLPYSASSTNYFQRIRKGASTQRFTNRQSELITQKSAPSHIRERGETSQRQRASHYMDNLTHTVSNMNASSITHTLTNNTSGLSGIVTMEQSSINSSKHFSKNTL